MTEWHRLFHAYGQATDAPKFLEALPRNDIIEIDDDRGWQFDGIPYVFIWSGLYCQGRLTPATAAAAHVIAGQISEPGFGARDMTLRPGMLFFFREIGRTALAAQDVVDLRAKAARCDEPAAQAWLDAFLAAPVPVFDWGDAQEPGGPFLAAAMIACYDLIPELFHVAVRFLTDTSGHTRRVAAMATATLVGHPDLVSRRPALVDYHLREAAAEEDPYHRASLVIGIGELGEQPQRWLRDPHPGVRICAAMAPALANDPRAVAVLLRAARQPTAFNTVFGTMHMPQLGHSHSVALIEALCQRVRDFDLLADGAIAALNIEDRRALEPYLRVAFIDGLPEADASTPAQRRFAQTAASRDELWSTGMTAWHAALASVGLPTDRNSWAAVGTERPDN